MTWKWVAVVLGGFIGSMLVFAIALLVNVLGDVRKDLNTTMTDVAVIKQKLGINGASAVADSSRIEG